jgi:hypothetical protein
VLGATAFGVGRPYVYALAVGGADGVVSQLESILAELDLLMPLTTFPHWQICGRPARFPSPPPRQGLRTHRQRERDLSRAARSAARACRGLISMCGRLGELDRSVWLERSVASRPLTRAVRSVLSPAAQKEDG